MDTGGGVVLIFGALKGLSEVLEEAWVKQIVIQDDEEEAEEEAEEEEEAPSATLHSNA